MAYPTGTLSLVLEDIDRRAISLKQFAQEVRAELAAGNTKSHRILQVYVNLKGERTFLQSAASQPGMAQFARDQKNNQSLDVVAEFNAMIAAIDGVTTWIETNFPKDGGGYLLAEQFSGGAITRRDFTPAQTAGLRTQLDTLISTIA